MKKLSALIAFLTLFSSVSLFSQQAIHLKNPSFEDTPRHSIPPFGWLDCGFPNESKPDTQPGAFDVTKRANDGATYLGLVVRDNETWEMVGQELNSPIKAQNCYEFSLYLARSALYLSGTIKDTIPINHVTPAELRIWGGNEICEKGQLLAETKIIYHGEWKKYTFKFKPKTDWNYILLEAFYQTPCLFPYNGNVLVDNASSIILIKCK